MYLFFSVLAKVGAREERWRKRIRARNLLIIGGFGEKLRATLRMQAVLFFLVLFITFLFYFIFLRGQSTCVTTHMTRAVRKQLSRVSSHFPLWVVSEIEPSSAFPASASTY